MRYMKMTARMATTPSRTPTTDANIDAFPRERASFIRPSPAAATDATENIKVFGSCHINLSALDHAIHVTSI